jgi:uncharacterized metal-binding protein
MPAGRTHDRITWLTLPLIGIITYLISQKWLITGIVSGSYLFSGLMFGPDLDIYSVQYKRWGIFRMIWNPYQKWITHRSFLSHGFMVGTVIRLLYLISILLITWTPIAVLISINHNFAIDWQDLAVKGLKLIINQYLLEAIALLIGLELGSMSHSISDMIGSAIKKRRSKKALAKKSKKKRKLTKTVKK